MSKRNVTSGRQRNRGTWVDVIQIIICQAASVYYIVMCTIGIYCTCNVGGWGGRRRRKIHVRDDEDSCCTRILLIMALRKQSKNRRANKRK